MRCSYEVEYRSSAQGMPTRGTITWLDDEGMRVASPCDAPVQPGDVLQLRFWVEASMRRKMGRVVAVEGGMFSVSFDLAGYVADGADLPPAPEPAPAPPCKPQPRLAAASLVPAPLFAGQVAPPQPRMAMPRGHISLTERWISRRTATHL